LPIYTTLVSFDPWNWRFVGSALLIVAISATVLIQRRRWPGAAALWISYLILLVPMLGLTEHPHNANDRYSYLPGVLWSFMIAALLLRVWHQRERRIVFAVGTAVVILCGVLSFRQASRWQNRETLLTHITSRMDPHPLRAEQDVLLGFVFRERGENERAAQCFRNALQADPNSHDAHGALADVLSEHRALSEAILHYREALRLKSDLPHVRQNFGIALGSAGQLNEAVSEFEQLLETNPKNANVRHNLAITLTQLGRTNEAAAHFAEARQLRAKTQ
jgi:protein O-mannosyl-transferase